MNNFDFRKWNLISGWLVFFIALTTYWLTAEPTMSFWDAGEYITTSSNLEVGHPPGAPLYQMIGAFFSLFASDVSQIALMVNLVSAFASAFTILFMFWSIGIILQNIISKTETLDTNKNILILGSAAVGSLAFTFTDSFWYSAVEAEVYAMASCIMAILFYLALRWEREMNTPRGNRWVVLIAFVVGLSFGVHFMGLLTIPAMGLLYYFKNYKTVTIKNFILAHLAVVGILLFIFMFMLPMTMRFFSASELFFVNSMGLPFDSGTVIAGLLMIALFYFLLKYTRKKGFVQLNTLMLAFLFIFIGFSSWMMLPIRANAGTVINENRPSDAQELLAYYNREQYGSQSLLYDAQFTEMYAGYDRNNPYKDDKPNYERDETTGKYIIVNNYKNAIPNLDDAHKTFLPRMWSTEHAANYFNIVGGVDFNVKREYRSEEALLNEVAAFKHRFSRGEIDSEEYHDFLRQFSDYLDIKKPSFGQNMRYLFQYQFGYMYWRYFMWNFAGRQNDVQGKNDIFDGNWISGIKFIDEMRLGPQSNLPSDVENNKGRNTYYFLPLILGLLGIVFHYGKDKSSWWVLMVFFLFTGLALKVYLNERPFEPRERDYALVGSFYVFAMWIGFGVYALFEIIKKYLQPKIAVPLVIVVGLLAAPVLLASQNWDDHDRSDRFTALAMAKKYLDSVDPNGIIFTIGDNDTFAIWYAQGIEEYRRDVRPINTSLFNTDWYIDDMKKAAFESAPIPSQLIHEQYRYGTRDYIIKHPQIEGDDTLSIKRWMDWVANDDPRLTVEMQSGQMLQTFPSKNIRIPVDKEAVLRNGIVAEKDAHLILDYIDVHIKSDVLYKNRMMMFDIIANNNWERPIYFTGGAFNDEEYLWMKDYLQLDGLAYKLVPIKTPVDKRNPFDMGRIDSEKMYEIVKDWDWGNSGSSDIYHDPETRKNAISYRGNIARLAEQLILEEEYEKAEEMLDLAMENMPVKYYGYYTLLEPFITGYFEVNQEEKGIQLYKEVAKTYQEKLDYYGTFSYTLQRNYLETILMDVERYRSLVGTLLYSENEEFLTSEAETFNSYLKKFQHFYANELEDEVFQEDSLEVDLENPPMDFPDEETLLKMIDSMEKAMNQE
tara:strand:+ start:168 stop:3497 length:3330 start_codon:yes stop_codon:yes gene_type:complete